MRQPNTVGEALDFATRYWEANELSKSRRGCNMMPIRAERCASYLGKSRRLSSLTASDGASLLASLKQGGLSRSSVATYYAAGRRMLTLAGLSTIAWPKPPTAPRRYREPVSDSEIEALRGWMWDQGYMDTVELMDLMRATGLRVEVEALNGDWKADGSRLLVKAGKGGHARLIPYSGPHQEPLRANGGLSYAGHWDRWKRGVKALGLREDFTPHDLRRHFIRRVYETSGKDIRVAQVLAGHTDIKTTSGYIEVPMEELEAAVRQGRELENETQS